MIQNQHIPTAIESFQKFGDDFNTSLLWHLVNGIVLSSPEFLSVAYYCKKEALGTPRDIKEADTVFVTFMTGSMKALKRVCPETIKFIAFKRGLKNQKGDRVYPIQKFKQLIN